MVANGIMHCTNTDETDPEFNVANRVLSVQRLVATCLDVSNYPADTEGPSFAGVSEQ